MVDRVWIISKKGEKHTAIKIIIAGIVLSMIIYLYFVDFKFGTTEIWLGLCMLIAALFVFLFIKYLSNWDNPKIIRMTDDEIITEEKFPNGDVKRFVIPINGIYRITIKRRKTSIEYVLPDSRDFIWFIIQPGYAKEDREKLQEVLNEILKRIDRDKVEVIQGR